jgi:Immunoglobulin-like domain of bacterial spore germination/Sporulation and spore germination
MSDRTDFMNPEFEPGEFDLVERRLRRALYEEAQQMEPSNRLDDILAGAGSGAGAPMRRSGPPRWLAPLASAAAVAVIAGTVWVATRDGNQPAPPVNPAPTSQAPAPSTAPTPSESPTTAPSQTTEPTTSAPSTQTALLPAYFVGPVNEKPTYKLFREFLRGTVPAGASDQEKAKAALELAMNAQPFSNTDGYLQPWSGTKVNSVTVTPQLITITLSNQGSPGIEDKELQRLGVQELVWTAQAAVAQGNIPVKFAIADGSDALFGSLSTADTYRRPPSAESWKDLAPIWITSPSRDQVLPAAKAVMVKGEATVFEANVQWELKKGRAVAKKGFATASEGAPGRGQYSFDLGKLAPGDYTIRVFEVSAADGTTVNAERSISFSVK